MPEIIITNISKVDGAFINSLNSATRQWELSAARGECEWICADCGQACAGGMPDECGYGNNWCTEIIKRDKQEALSAKEEK